MQNVRVSKENTEKRGNIFKIFVDILILQPDTGDFMKSYPKLPAHLGIDR